jgi:PKD repeat protein
VYDSVTVNLISGKQTVPLTLAIPAGNNLLLTTVGNPALYYNSTGAAYPYNALDGSAQITGNNTNIPGAYYYFYNWRLEQPACASPTTPVTVFVLGTNGGSFSASGTGSPTVTFTPADTNATRYAWNFGDGNTSTDVYPTHTYSSAGTYTVQLIVSNDTCTDTLSKSFSTVQLGINDLSTLSAFSAFPNPVKGHLGLSLNSVKQMNDCQIKITNILGQNEYSNTVDLQSGMNKLGVDITSLAPGVYFVSLQNGKDIVTTKFVKAGE